MIRTILLAFALTIISGTSQAQIREIPKAVEETFSNQYKNAANVEYRDQLVRVEVRFELDGVSMLAIYTNKGVWKETQESVEYDDLPVEVKDGFDKSKFADREVAESAKIHLPGGTEQYRILAKKNDIEKKYLFFNSKGRLLRTSMTL